VTILSTISFKVRDVHQHKDEQEVSFRSEDNPSVADFASALPEHIGLDMPEDESLALFNTTQKKALNQGSLVDQVNTGDEVVYSTEGAAGSRE
jgi:hypothetical protein